MRPYRRFEVIRRAPAHHMIIPVSPLKHCLGGVGGDVAYSSYTSVLMYWHIHIQGLLRVFYTHSFVSLFTARRKVNFSYVTQRSSHSVMN